MDQPMDCDARARRSSRSCARKRRRILTGLPAS